MTTQTTAIILLLVSFLIMIFLRFPIAYAVAISSLLSLPVYGKRYQFIQFDGGSILYYHGMSDGLRWYIG